MVKTVGTEVPVSVPMDFAIAAVFNLHHERISTTGVQKLKVRIIIQIQSLHTGDTVVFNYMNLIKYHLSSLQELHGQFFNYTHLVTQTATSSKQQIMWL